MSSDAERLYGRMKERLEESVHYLLILHAMNFATEAGFTPWVEPMTGECKGGEPLTYRTYCDYNEGTGEFAILEIGEVSDWIKNKIHQYLSERSLKNIPSSGRLLQ